MNVAVVIPMYRTALNAHETVALHRCVSTLGRHPLIVVKPDSLDVTALQRQHPALQTQTFDDAYFANIAGYNRLLMSEAFYATFAEYEYILICQLDTFIFRDDLLDWCGRGFDYVGAPQFADIRPAPDHVPTLRDRISRMLQRPLLNGGLSLRNVAACRRLLRVFYSVGGRWTGNEDAFFSLHFPRFLPFRPLMRLPNPDEALRFAIEFGPAQSVARLGSTLPMGCHAWEKYDLDFWRPIFKEHGYDV